VGCVDVVVNFTRFTEPREVLPQPGHDLSPLTSGRRAKGSKKSINGPSPRFPRNGRFAGEKPKGLRVRALWAAMDSSAFFTAGTSTATTGDMALAR
jgi:hypothetical protein